MHFVVTLLLGSLMILLNLGIQVWAVSWVLKVYASRDAAPAAAVSMKRMAVALSVMLFVLLLGHILQFASWALLFVLLGEFAEFPIAFYHSTVNFTSLGYGDIVMSDRWRLLGAMEAANGVLMFGLTAGLVLSVMNRMLVIRQSNH